MSTAFQDLARGRATHSRLVADVLGDGSAAAQITVRHLQALVLESTPAYWSQRAATFDRLGRRDIAAALRSRALWLRSHQADPASLTDCEQWAHDRACDVSWAIPPLELATETTAGMIARHRRVLTALDEIAEAA